MLTAKKRIQTRNQDGTGVRYLCVTYSQKLVRS